MHSIPETRVGERPAVAAFYRSVLGVLSEHRIPFLIGGAYALHWYTGIRHPAKDLDIMVRMGDSARALAALHRAGYQTELTYPHWLGKAFCGAAFVDIIFNAGNGLVRVDDDWFRYAVRGEIFGVPVEVCSAVELIWSKAFVMERERYDGADISHLIRNCGANLDWARLLERFGAHWPVLLSHLVLFRYVYPSEQACIPRWVMRRLCQRMRADMDQTAAAPRLCRGTLLSREQYLVDVERGYADARLAPGGTMSPQDIARWTAAIDNRNGPTDR